VQLEHDHGPNNRLVRALELLIAGFLAIAPVI
jgi:hypothetical protein